MEPIIKTENLCFEYKNEESGEVTEVLKNVSAEIKKGEFVAVLGHNGSGKSTFAKHINAILMPKSGKVFVDGIDTSLPDRLFDIRKIAGMVFQNPDNQMVANIVEDDVAFAPENLGVPQAEIRRRVDNALKAVNMSDFVKHAPHMLSGGQKQRIAIAGVLAMEPQIIILDEPTAMLDPGGRREIMETLIKLNREREITVLLITHYMDEAALADRVLVMDNGEIKMSGTPSEIFVQVERLRSLGLDTPQTTELVYDLKKRGIDIKQDVLSVDDCASEILRLWRAR
ncbi:MAG: energy-coupling factor transporter ATPase [Eubacteriales bacterium]|nr:energy-coupling factor transporter ATPase [Eubacteriales bacterium]